MDHKNFNIFCENLKASTHVVQWGGSHVWKVGGKVYAISGLHNDVCTFTFKVSPISYEILKNQPGLRPAPYLASRGLKWIQHYGEPGLSDKDLKRYIEQSYKIVSQGLSKIKQRELGLLQSV